MREVDEILEDEQLLELVYERLRLRGTNWRRCGGIRKDNTRSESVINGATVLSGATAIATTWKSSTITSKELEMNKTETLLPPVHPGEIGMISRPAPPRRFCAFTAITKSQTAQKK